MGIKAPIDGCSYCGSKLGYYTKEQASGSLQYQHNFDGSEKDNATVFDGLTFKGGKFAYCISCDKRLFKMDDLKQNTVNKN
ncbi:hypothetical protein [Bacillus bombysepticus]|uniref:hypothetical protein n=1 Tax=Bacillus bombysepticus TaxID=658666 RepID=UPI003017156D